MDDDVVVSLAGASVVPTDNLLLNGLLPEAVVISVAVAGGDLPTEPPLLFLLPPLGGREILALFFATFAVVVSTTVGSSSGNTSSAFTKPSSSCNSGNDVSASALTAAGSSAASAVSGDGVGGAGVVLRLLNCSLCVRDVFVPGEEAAAAAVTVGVASVVTTVTFLATAAGELRIRPLLLPVSLLLMSLLAVFTGVGGSLLTALTGAGTALGTGAAAFCT